MCACACVFIPDRPSRSHPCRERRWACRLQPTGFGRSCTAVRTWGGRGGEIRVFTTLISSSFRVFCILAAQLLRHGDQPLLVLPPLRFGLVVALLTLVQVGFLPAQKLVHCGRQGEVHLDFHGARNHLLHHDVTTLPLLLPPVLHEKGSDGATRVADGRSGSCEADNGAAEADVHVRVRVLLDVGAVPLHDGVVLRRHADRHLLQVAQTAEEAFGLRAARVRPDDGNGRAARCDDVA